MKTLTDEQLEELRYWLCPDNCECESCLVLNEVLASRKRIVELEARVQDLRRQLRTTPHDFEP